MRGGVVNEAAFNLTREDRLTAIWVAVGTEGAWAGKMLGRVGTKEFIKQLHQYVERLESGLETRWPPDPTYNGLPCRFEMMRPPRLTGV